MAELEYLNGQQPALKPETPDSHCLQTRGDEERSLEYLAGDRMNGSALYIAVLQDRGGAATAKVQYEEVAAVITTRFIFFAFFSFGVPGFHLAALLCWTGEK